MIDRLNTRFSVLDTEASELRSKVMRLESELAEAQAKIKQYEKGELDMDKVVECIETFKRHNDDWPPTVNELVHQGLANSSAQVRKLLRKAQREGIVQPVGIDPSTNGRTWDVVK